MSFRWITKPEVIAIHQEQLSEHGGLTGIRDEGLLDSAIARPINLYNYESQGIAKYAAAYAFGIIRNHPFNDGNKRTGFVTALTFLLLNGHYTKLTEPDVVLTISKLAAGKVSEEALSEWIENSLVSV